MSTHFFTKILFSIVLAVSISDFCFASESSYVQGADESLQSYVARSDEAYGETTWSYDGWMKEWEAKIDNYFGVGQYNEIRQVLANIYAIEDLTHRNESGIYYNLTAYTDTLFALGMGSLVKYDGRQGQEGRVVGSKIFGSRFGLSTKIHALDFEVPLLIASMIHSRLTETRYLAPHIPTADYLFHHPATGLPSALDRGVMNHRICLYAFQILTAGIEHALNREDFGGISDLARPRTLASSERVEKVWDTGVTYVKEKILNAWSFASYGGLEAYPDGGVGRLSPQDAERLKNATIDVQALEKVLNHYKSLFIALFVPIANKSSDRKHRIVRKKHEEAQLIETVARQEDVQAVAGALSEAKYDPNASNLGSQLITVIAAKKIKFSVDRIGGVKGTMPISFDNPGGAKALQQALLYNLDTPVPSIVVKAVVLDRRITPTREFVKASVNSSPRYLLMKSTTLSQAETKEYEEKVKNMLVFTTDAPDVDGIYAYMQDEAGIASMNMIATPIEGSDVRKSIGFLNEGKYMREVERSVADLLAGGELAPKVSEAKESKAVPVVPIDAGELKLEVLDIDSIGPLNKTNVLGKNFTTTKAGDAFLKVFQKLSFTAQALTADKVANVTATLSAPGAIKTTTVGLAALNAGSFFGGTSLAGKDMATLYKVGHFVVIDGAVVYIQLGQAGKDHVFYNFTPNVPIAQETLQKLRKAKIVVG